jgi:hypothetical protein
LLNLFVGAGLTSFLILAHAFFSNWPTTTWALSFDIVGLALLFNMKKEKAAPVLAPLSPGVQIILLGCLAVIGWLLYLHLQRPSMDRSRLQQEMALARLYNDDRSCHKDVLKQLAGQTPALGSGAATAPGPTEQLCTVQWMRVERRPGQCVILLDGRQNLWSYCTWDREFMWIRRKNIRVGDLIPAQMAFGKPSAFLRPQADIVDMLLYPRGEIIDTQDNPDRVFRERIWRCFWVVFAYLFLGVLVLSKLLRRPV